jgi:hypothetical protein
MAGPIPMTHRIRCKLRGRHGWNRSTWKRHQNTRECARRLVQIAKGRLSGGTPGFISPAAEYAATTLRLRALGLHAAGEGVQPAPSVARRVKDLFSRRGRP